MATLLSREQRELLLRPVGGGEAHAKIAGELDVSKSSASRLLAEAIRILSKSLG